VAQLFETLGIDPQVILANIISFLLLLWLLSKVMVKPLSSVLSQRREEIESAYQRIADENTRIEQTQADLSRRMDEIESEARAKIEEAGAAANRLREDILSEAREQADKVRERCVQDIEREREKALQSIREHVADLVAQASEKIIAQSMTDQKHREMIAAALDGLRDAGRN